MASQTTLVDALNIHNISKEYIGHKALENVSLNVPKGSIYGLLGPNGAGKTTLIRIITRIINADSGQVLFNGQPMTDSDVARIGYLPEERGLYKKMKVGEQLLYLARLKGVPRAEAIEKIRSWLTKLEIESWWNSNVQDLSKGMQQKIQFIATILADPELIILDEPFSGFDPINAAIIKNEILNLRDRGATIIFSTHRMESVEELCEHIALINRSQKILEGSKEEIKDAYRNGVFQVTHTGQLEGIPAAFEVLDVQSDGSMIRSDIQLKEGAHRKDLLLYLANHTEVVSFNEKIPTMNEIFIRKVNGEGHE